MRASIHQPQYIPWLGYFFKILHSDVFVLFDTVQYPRGKHFGSRNQIKTAQGAQWLTVPVLGRSDLLSYSEIAVDGVQNWAQKHWRSIDLAYRKAPCFEQYSARLQEIYLGRKWERLTDFSHALLQFCFDALGLAARIVRASALPVDKAAMPTDEYIFALLKAVGADAYISGQGEGSMRYIRADEFASRRVALFFYSFAPSAYPQLWGDFVADLSVLDVLFNCGERARALLQQSGKLLPA
jgi:hypothetical protein